jgi:GNAT superfamily N-acetyltransferase
MIRPMREEDVDAAHALAVLTFDAYARARGEEPEPPPDPSTIPPRYLHPLRTDPGGCWVAEEDGRLAGCAIALVREGVWGLSLLVVHPDRQSAGLGRALLRAAWEYGAGARGWIVMASGDPRALRAYARLGLTGHPVFVAEGTPRGVAMPDGVRVGSLEDQALCDAADRHARGAAHGPDIGAYLEMGLSMVVAEDRGYAMIRHDAGVRQLAAFDEDGARDVLRGALAKLEGHKIAVESVSALQAWAVPVCLDAGLELRAGSGALFTGGDVGPFTPYLPSGAFL